MEKRYSTLNRKRKLVFIFTDKEKYDILYRYLVLKQSQETIYVDYASRCKLSYFKTVPTYLLEEKELLRRVLLKMTNKTTYEDCMGWYKILGQKEESYWKTEDDMFFAPIKAETLSPGEMDIYYNN